jgi:hypothetical protein
VGDSITVADGNLSYPLQLGRLLGAKYNVTNRGVSGHTMLNSGLCGAINERARRTYATLTCNNYSRKGNRVSEFCCQFFPDDLIKTDP